MALDTILLVDGGTDRLMRGDESGLGTPHEDIASLTAVDELDAERKLLACIAFGVDYFHGVCRAHFLEAVAELTQRRAYLGMISLLEEMPEVNKYRQATEAVFAAMPNDISIVSSSVLSALAGNYGNHHATLRTRNSQLWINPLMPVYWCFQLTPVARRVLYREAMKGTETFTDVQRVIKEFRSAFGRVRPRQEIPV